MLATAETYPTNVLARADLISRATVHALLALGPEPAPEIRAVVTYDAIEAIADLGEDAPPKPLPRKRAARKTTTSKESSK